MDPNETLSRIRMLMGSTDTSDLLWLAELVYDLDEWLNNGGSLPKDWDHNG